MAVQHTSGLLLPPISPLLTLALEAGDIIMEFYTGTIDVERKDDDSPVTLADKTANDHIVAALETMEPRYPIVSEEGDKPADPGETYWLVDPLDGTKSFIKREGQFTVNIGLVHQGQPVLGVVYVPVEKTMYYTADNGAAFRQKNGDQPETITVRDFPGDGLTAIASKSHRSPETDAFLDTQRIKECISASSSLKFCLLAEGNADVYPRLSPTMQWDTAAAHAILLEAGGRVHTADGRPFSYHSPTHPEGNKERDYLNDFFIAWGGQG